MAAVALSLALCPTLAEAGDLDALLFGSLDAGSATFVTAGAKLSLGTLDQDGFVALASLGAGRRAERGPDGARTRYTGGGAVVVGYQWFFDWGVVAAYAGPEGATEVLVGRCVAALGQPHFGLRLHSEIWARPTEETLLQATAIGGSTRNSVWTRVAWGYRLWNTYLGPEIGLYVDGTDYRKLSLGLHATDFMLAGYSFRVSAGLQSETGHRGMSPYVALSIWSPW